jgi:hypothetical protein
MKRSQIELEVNHIFESGANEIRVVELFERLLERSENEKWIRVEDSLPERDENGYMESVLVELINGNVATDVYRLDYNPPEWFHFRDIVARWRKYPKPPIQ